MYATIEDLQARSGKDLSGKQTTCNALLADAALIIDCFNKQADISAKRVVSCNMVIRAIGNDTGVPLGATQGSMSALGYSQSWTVSGGSVGELYLTKIDKKLLGSGNKLGAHSPLEDL